MSSLLKQAIVDAEALKEAALKNAEQAVIEKYAGEIKEAVESLLEAEIDERTPDPSQNLNTITLEGEKACPCPEPGEKEDIELKAITPPDAGAKDEPEPLPAPGLEEEMPDEEFLEEQTFINLDLLEEHINSLEEEFHDEDEFSKKQVIELEEEDDSMLPDEGLLEWGDDLEECDDISEDDLYEELIEELTMDLQEPALARGSTSIGPPTAYEWERADDFSEIIDKLKDQEKENDKLKENIKKLSKKNKILINGLKESKEMNNSLREHLMNVNTSNAKLLYTNKILSSASLNERQKIKIVEAISKTETVKEAKVIYETLQNSVGSSEKKRPKSLNEAVTRKPSLYLSRTRKQENTRQDDTVSDRWKQLAGIK